MDLAHVELQIMKLPPATFWTWFAGFAKRLPSGDPPDQMLDELLGQLRRFDDRIYYERSTNTGTNELIFTASGDVAVFPAIDALADRGTEHRRLVIRGVETSQGGYIHTPQQ